jgi:hypothetical protein
VTFRRSPSSLNSLNIFYKVDVVVFCEGGTVSDLDQSIASKTSDGTLDTFYWSYVVSFLWPSRKFYIKSAGGKETLRAIASDVESSGLTTITVCLDSDYDMILSNRLNYTRVAYTHGYSWENDTISQCILDRLIRMYIGDGTDQRAIIHECISHLQVLYTSMVRWCEVDISLVAQGRPAIFERSKPMSCLDITNGLPLLRELRLSDKLTTLGYKRKPKRKLKLLTADVPHVMFGKLIAKIAFHITVTAVRRVVPDFKLQYDNFMRQAVSLTMEALNNGQITKLSGHHSEQRGAF